MKKYIFILFISLFCFINVKAFDKAITMNSEGVALTLDSSLNVSTGIGLSDAKYPWFHVKNSNKGTVVCLSGINVNTPSNGATCTLTSETNYGVAYIIDLINKSNGTANEKYYWTEVLVNGHLNKLEQLNDTNSFMYINVINNNNKKILNTNLSFNKILTESKKYETSVMTNPTITVDGKKNVELIFTKNSDGYYYSNPITISSNVTFDLGTLSNSKFTYDANGNSYIFKIKESDIEVGATESFENTITVQSSYMTSSRYNCGTNIQEVGLLQVETKTPTDSIVIKGSVSKENLQIEFSKVDENNKNLPGAKFMLQSQAQKENNEDGIILISKEQGTMVVDSLLPGLYYLTEIESPIGYNKISKTMEIVIDANGKITVDGKEHTGVIVIKNTLTEAEISKISVVDNKELKGATLEVLDSENKKISCTVIIDGKKETLKECSWVSSDKPVKIVGLPIGKYYLQETIAPEGYDLNTEKVMFEIKGDGTVTKVQMKNALSVEVPDTLSARSALLVAIAMIDIAIGIGIITYVKKNKIQE